MDTAAAVSPASTDHASAGAQLPAVITQNLTQVPYKPLEAAAFTSKTGLN